MNRFLISSLIVHAIFFGSVVWFTRTDFKAAYSNAVTNLNIEMTREQPSTPAPPSVKTAPRKSDEIPLNAKGKTNADVQSPAAPQNTNTAAGADSALPVPTAEYLVSKMPRLAREYRIPYPPEAKQRGIYGSVVMDLLIDAYGKVRKVEVISGPDPILIASAQNAILKFEFEPAEADGKPLAVKTRYVYEFLLEK